MKKPLFALIIVCLTLAPAGALSQTVTLLNGVTYEAELIGFFTLDGLDHFVFRMTDGSMMAYTRAELATVQFTAAPGAPAAPVAPPAPAAPPAASVAPAVAPVPAQPQPQPQYVTTEREPNDQVGAANLIQPGADVTGALPVGTDVDIYKITVPTHGSFHVTCTQPTDLYLAVLDSAGNQLVGGDFGGVNAKMVADAEAYEPGDYYVLVRPYSSSYKSDTAYTLRVDFREARDAFEPNNTIEQASPVVSGRQFESFIHRPGDVDYYRLNIAGPSTISITSTQPADYHLSIVDSTGAKQLAGGDLGGVNKDMELVADVYEAGAYYVLMRGYNASTYNMHVPYNMTITVTPGGADRFEPNDEPSKASRAPLGQVLPAFLSKPGDVDHYAVEVAGPAKISVAADQPADMHLSILGPDGKTAIVSGDYGDKGTKISMSQDVFQPGVYYVVLRGYSTSVYDLHVPYNLTISATPALPDAAEPNDSAQQAKPIQLGQTVTGVIPSGTDQDWWQFDTTFVSKVRITCTQPADFLFRVVDSSGKEITRGDFGGKGSVIDTTLQLSAFNRYHIVVAPYSSTHYNMTEPYQLTVMPTL